LRPLSYIGDTRHGRPYQPKPTEGQVKEEACIEIVN